MGIKESLELLRQWRPDFASPGRPPLEPYYGFFVAALIGWAAADLTLMAYRPSMLPSEAPPVRQQRPRPMNVTQLTDYNVISSRNIFNEDGKIAPALSAGPAEDSSDSQTPVLSQLPLGLAGTIVHFNPKLSIATIEVRNRNETLSFRPDEEIEGVARIVRVERKRVIFTNLSNRRLEYIEIPEDVAFNFDIKAPTGDATNELVEKKGEFEFAVKRTDLDGLTSNLSSLLQQARMEPRIGADGQIDGFCFVSIQPNTPYEKLGFRMGDCIKSVNGETINSPGKAMETYQLLKQSSFIQLGVERGGRDEKFNYSIQ
jgi:general secretion pathway protein C